MKPLSGRAIQSACFGGFFSRRLAFSLANELIERDINSNSTPDYEPSYSLTGHQIDDGKDYKYVYDAFGRLMEVHDRDTED